MEFNQMVATDTPVELSIMIVNWNSADFLRACLSSVFQNTEGVLAEVIVIDNASYDRANKLIAQEFPQVRYVQSTVNLGFAKANNLGFQYSKGKILLFLNPDTVILPSALRKMITSLNALPGAGAIGARLLNGDGSLQTSCVQALPTLLNKTLDTEILRRYFPNSRLWGIAPLFREGDSPRQVEMISGAALMVRREVFERVGMFSTEYFMYGEDADLCHKISASGSALYYLPTAQIVHYGGQSAKHTPESCFSVFVMQESLDLYLKKFHGKTYAAGFRVMRAFTAVLRVSLIGILLMLPQKTETRSYHRVALKKWLTIFRWALALQARPNTATGNRSNAQKQCT